MSDSDAVEAEVGDFGFEFAGFGDGVFVEGAEVEVSALVEADGGGVVVCGDEPEAFAALCSGFVADGGEEAGADAARVCHGVVGDDLAVVAFDVVDEEADGGVVLERGEGFVVDGVVDDAS